MPPLPPPVRTEPVEDKGTVMVLAPELLSASNPEHRRSVAGSRRRWTRRAYSAQCSRSGCVPPTPITRNESSRANGSN
ncbi:Imm52 family immunity protein [Cystobacter fuscus]